MFPASLFVSPEVKPRDVALPNGEIHTLYFREVSAKEFRRVYFAEGQDDAERELAVAQLIAASLCEPDGAPAMTVDQALTLKGVAINAILGEISVVNGLKKGNDLKPGAKNGSGTS